MEVNIGGQTIKVVTEFTKQDFVRDTEEDISRLYAELRRHYPAKEDRELLAMMAYQYASYYHGLKARHEEAVRMALDCSARIDAITAGGNDD